MKNPETSEEPKGVLFLSNSEETDKHPEEVHEDPFKKNSKKPETEIGRHIPKTEII